MIGAAASSKFSTEGGPVTATTTVPRHGWCGAEAGTFGTRECKLCDDGIVVKGEYGITNALLSKGFNIATLMSRYANVPLLPAPLSFGSSTSFRHSPRPPARAHPSCSSSQICGGVPWLCDCRPTFQVAAGKGAVSHFISKGPYISSAIHLLHSWAPSRCTRTDRLVLRLRHTCKGWQSVGTAEPAMAAAARLQHSQ